MNIKATSSSPERGYLLSRSDKATPSVDQKLMSNEIPFAGRAGFNAFGAGFTAGTTKEFHEAALPGEITSGVKLGMDIAVLPLPGMNFLGLFKEWENACGRHGEIAANEDLMAGLERDCLGLEAELASWPQSDPGRPDRQKEVDGKRALCQRLVARNNALRSLAPPIEGLAATWGSGVIPLGGALNNCVTAALKVNAQAATDIAKVADVAEAAAVHDLSDVAVSTVSGLAVGLLNSASHLVRAFPEVDRAMAQLDRLKAAEHRLAEAVETCLPQLQGHDGRREVLDNVIASMNPLIGNARSQARIIAVDGFFRTVQGASGLALKSAGIAAAVLGPAAPFAAGVAIAGMAMGAGWLTWQAARLWWAQTLRVEATKIESQLKNDVAIARKSQETGTPHVSAAMAPWLKLINACREDGAQGALTSFLRQAGVSEAVVDACLSKKEAIDLVVPLFSAFKESLLTATPEVTQERIHALKKRKDPRDALNGFILEVENPGSPAKPLGNKTLKPMALKNQGNGLTLEDVQRHLSAFKQHKEVADLRHCQGHAARLLEQFFVDAKDRPQDMRTLEKDLLTGVKLYIDLSRNSDERAIACLSGRYPGIRGKAKFGDRVVKDTAEAYLRSKYAGPAFEEKLVLLQHLAKKGALVRRSTFMEWAKTYKTWQPTEAATDMAKWLADPKHVPGASLALPVFEMQRSASTGEHGSVVESLKDHFPGMNWSAHNLGAAVKALDACNAKALFDSASQWSHVDAWDMAMGEASSQARANELNSHAVRNALRLRRGLAPRADKAEPAMDPVKALKELHVQHPRVAQAVLEALMGKRFEVPDLPSDMVEQVRAIRLAYGDHFLEDETKGSSVFFIPCKPDPGESEVLASLAKALCRKDAKPSGKTWPSVLVTDATLVLLSHKTRPGFTAVQKRLAMADQLQRNLDRARQGTPTPESISLLWTPVSYVGTRVEHDVRSQHLHALFPAERYDEADKADKVKCQDIDQTVTMLNAWNRKTPGGREVLRAIALGEPVRAMAAMHWLFDRRDMLSGVQQAEVRQIAVQAMSQKGGSSKAFLKRLANLQMVWRTRQPNDGTARYPTLAEFNAAMESKSVSGDVTQEALNQQVKAMRHVSSTASLASTHASGGDTKEHSEPPVSLPEWQLFNERQQPKAPKADVGVLAHAGDEDFQ